MKDVVIISNYWHFPWEKESSRYLSIADSVKGRVDLELITSTFYHRKKHQRTCDDIRYSQLGYKVTLIEEPGYRKNIDFHRIISHGKFARNVRKYLENRKTPDLIYLFVPSLSLGKEIADYAKSKKVKLVIDVLDLWPEAFAMICPVPILSDILFLPMKKMANFIYASANEIVAVSDTYVERALESNPGCKNTHSVLIGTDLNLFDRYAVGERKENHSEFLVAYIGMLGKSYDINCVSKAISILKEKGLDNITFLVMGDGPRREEFEQYAKKLSITAEFTGQLPYGEMVRRLVRCDVAANPIVNNAVPTFINKHSDYFAAGVPMINTQEYNELKIMIESNQCGFNCKSGSAEEVAASIEKLYKDPVLKKQMGENSRKVAEKYFDRNRTYEEIAEVICG